MRSHGQHEFLFILLGASNLARGYFALTRQLSQNISRCEFLNAMGPGRGYCVESGMFNFTYPPIGECRIMENVDVQQSRRIAVLLTDIGNDIMYGLPEQSLVESFDSLIEKSLLLNAEVFLTSIHVDVRQDMGRETFKLLKGIFYPNSSVTYDKADLAVKTINKYIEDKSIQNERVHLVSGLGVYCGMDKIHYNLFKSHFAWLRVANVMLKELGVTSSRNIGMGTMAVSLCKNLNRLITSDMFKIMKKPEGFY